jgi:hypothetical protein
MRLQSTFEVKQNLRIIARERGKIVARRDGHNIWLNTGREFVAQLISYSLMSPLTPVRNDRVRYMGFGIGGTRQLIPSIANSSPQLTHYPGTNVQTDQDPTVTGLERPVRISGTSTAPPYNALDVWLGQIQAPPEFPQSNKVIFRRLLQSFEVSYSPYTTVPLSEVGLFTDLSNPLLPANVPIAYDTFDSLSKTDAVDLEFEWTITT